MIRKLFSRQLFFQKLFSAGLILLLLFSTLGYSAPAWSAPLTLAAAPSAQATSQTRLSDGQYPVQQASYDDSDGSYTLMLLNTKPGESSVFRTGNLQMARLTDDELAAGQKSYLAVEKGQSALHLAEDFRIEYVHTVTETEPNPQTGEPQVVVVRRENSFWQPFAGALAGQIIGNMLFTPHYYFPPVYQPGGVLTGYGSYGRTYDQAVRQYQTRYNTAPAEVRNRQTRPQFRTTGRIRSNQAKPSGSTFGSKNASKTPSTTVTPRKANNKQLNRPTGSGYGSSSLKRSNAPSKQIRKPGNSFGSSRSMRRAPARRH